MGATQILLALVRLLPWGKCPGFSAKTVHFPPEVGLGIGSTDLSRRTCSLSLPGKCRVFRRKWFTFPRGRLGYRLHRPLWRHSQFPPWGKCREFLRKRFTFPRGRLGYRLHRPLSPALAVSPSRESAGFFRENGSLSPADCRGTGFTGISGDTRHSLPRGKCREFLRKRFTFPRGRQGYRSHRPLWWHLAFPPPRESAGNSCEKWFTFPRGRLGYRLHRPSLAALAVSPSRESAGLFHENGSLSLLS